MKIRWMWLYLLGRLRLCSLRLQLVEVTEQNRLGADLFMGGSG